MVCKDVWIASEVRQEHKAAWRGCTGQGDISKQLVIFSDGFLNEFSCGKQIGKVADCEHMNTGAAIIVSMSQLPNA